MTTKQQTFGCLDYVEAHIRAIEAGKTFVYREGDVEWVVINCDDDLPLEQHKLQAVGNVLHYGISDAVPQVHGNIFDAVDPGSVEYFDTEVGPRFAFASLSGFQINPDHLITYMLTVRSTLDVSSNEYLQDYLKWPDRFYIGPAVVNPGDPSFKLNVANKFKGFLFLANNLLRFKQGNVLNFEAFLGQRVFGTEGGQFMAVNAQNYLSLFNDEQNFSPILTRPDGPGLRTLDPDSYVH